ncbi:hypothetical protein GLAREA_11290 [Glarea lozoyensis ATCC 20868]|uniref:Uncharacterized protein n=1 Tax=Glarea lozoyensis (strain ATCC 20868 / MF5171) TaxID=1116229 RepID=S3DCY0_GLAL2|nr:uncharacterized protein GLAREA_11290 [Glarea lozoyensis ATCC 20868]EPE35590.1 hypothetical protein GLAREA_11290 [Glarea lozoyensis ATCC 20868]
MVLTHANCPTPAGLSKECKRILKGFGGWTMFMASYQLDPFDDEDAAMGERILKALGESEEEEEEEKKTS